ncbi:MAG: TSUP family transporter [Pseudomonadota bacterium]|nr:TSUP family transporter [Pseudomonadota bacterium]
MEPIYLAVIAFCSSLFTACAGLGGGILLLAMMLQIFPPNVVIPLHGITQFFSNASRALLLRSFIAKDYVIPFTIGSFLGVVIFIPLITIVDQVIGSLILGIFILVATWRPSYLKLRSVHATISGAITGGLGLILGAIGPLAMSAHPKENWIKEQIVANHATVMACQHGLKVVAFSVIGINLIEYSYELVGLVLGAAAGTFVGTKLLTRISDDRFRMLLNIVLTILAIRMIYENLTSLALG